MSLSSSILLLNKEYIKQLLKKEILVLIGNNYTVADKHTAVIAPQMHVT